jgi:hypothetical protein
VRFGGGDNYGFTALSGLNIFSSVVVMYLQGLVAGLMPITIEVFCSTLFISKYLSHLFFYINFGRKIKVIEKIKYIKVDVKKSKQ